MKRGGKYTLEELGALGALVVGVFGSIGIIYSNYVDGIYKPLSLSAIFSQMDYTHSGVMEESITNFNRSMKFPIYHPNNL